MRKLFIVLGIILGLVLAAPVGLAQDQNKTDINRIDIWIGGATSVSSLPNIGFAPVIKAQWRNIILGYGFAAMTEKEAWINLEIGVLTQYHERNSSYIALFGAVMGRDIKNFSFLSLMIGVVGGVEIPVLQSVNAEIKGGVGLSTSSKIRVWAQIGINVLFWSFDKGWL